MAIAIINRVMLFQVMEDTDKLSQAAWVCMQQRANVNRLVIARQDSSPALCCQRAHILDTTVFVEANKVLQYQVSNF